MVPLWFEHVILYKYTDTVPLVPWFWFIESSLLVDISSNDESLFLEKITLSDIWTAGKLNRQVNQGRSCKTSSSSSVAQLVDF